MSAAMSGRLTVTGIENESFIHGWERYSFSCRDFETGNSAPNCFKNINGAGGAC